MKSGFQVKNNQKYLFIASIRHPNIIAYKEAFFDVPSMTLNIVMEFAAGGSLTDYIDNMKKKGEYITSDKCWNYICQMLNGKIYLIVSFKVSS